MARPYSTVVGLNSTMSTLKKADKVLYKEARKEVIKSADPIIRTARSRLLDSSPGNWGAWRGGYSRGKASRGIRAQLRNERVAGYKGRQTIFRVVQNNAGGAIYDNAGSRGNYSPPVARGAAFVDLLSRRSGFRAQRSLWPAALKHRSEVEKYFVVATFNMADVLNAELRSRGYSRRGAAMIVQRGFA